MGYIPSSAWMPYLSQVLHILMLSCLISPISFVDILYGKYSFAYLMQLDDIIWAPSFTHLQNSLRSSSLSTKGLSMNTGIPASTKGLHLCTCSCPLSVAMITASTSPIFHLPFLILRALSHHFLLPLTIHPRNHCFKITLLH